MFKDKEPASEKLEFVNEKGERVKGTHKETTP